MAEAPPVLNPAEEASERALRAVYASLDAGDSFLVEAGAGAGKTYTLTKALQFLIARDQFRLMRRHQRIACITFTNVAREEIEARTDRSPLVFCDTIHAFCWSLIRGFQRQIRERLPQLTHWPDKIAEHGELGDRLIEYSLGHRSISDEHVSLHHDDVLRLMVALMDSAKFRRIVTDKYPVILIDEYPDTNADWVAAIRQHFLGQPGSPQFGFFGDHWQKIYGDGCGKIEHPSLTVIGKEANFRSVATIVDCLNRMRPELPQFVVDPADQGNVHVFHTNAWRGTRRTGQHWGGDLLDEQASVALEAVCDRLAQQGWDLGPAHTKILMLTHRVLANKQGYGTLPSVFAYNESFTKKEHPHIAFFADGLEPACHAYESRQYGVMFDALGTHSPAITSHGDKQEWSAAMDRLIELRNDGTVGQVIEHLRQVRRPRVPERIERRERELDQFEPEDGQEMPRVLAELRKLRAVPYREVIALCRYLAGHSPFETKHGVKGAEFENVLVVVGRGWNQYNFNDMLERSQDITHIPADRQKAFERNRNLFYVTCSRPKRRLAILFTQRLSDIAMQTVSDWFGQETIEDLAL